MSHLLPFDPGETLLVQVRKHWFVLLGPVIVTLLAALVPFLGYFLAAVYIPEFADLVRNYTSVLIFAYALWCLVWWTFLFMRWTDYYLDVWYVTDKKIVDIDQRGVFHREVSTLRFERVQDITIETAGIIQTLLNFGDVHVQTAGDQREIIIKHAKHPESVKRLIAEQIDRVIERRSSENGQPSAAGPTSDAV